MDKSSRLTVGIIVAIKDEKKALNSALNTVSEETFFKRNFVVGNLCGIRVVIGLSGVGKVNAAVTTAVMIHRYAPTWIVNSGIAGGLVKTMEAGDLILASELLYHDANVVGLGCRPGQLPGLPARFPADTFLLERAVETLQGKSLRLFKGLVVSGDSFISSGASLKKITEVFPEAVAVDMESAAVAQVCYEQGVPCGVLRAVSDTPHQSGNLIVAKKNLHLAAEAVAKGVVRVVTVLAKYESGYKL